MFGPGFDDNNEKIDNQEYVLFLGCIGRVSSTLKNDCLLKLVEDEGWVMDAYLEKGKIKRLKDGGIAYE